LQKAQQRQEELLGQVNTLSEELQAKVSHLTAELDASRSSYQALQAERDALSAELRDQAARFARNFADTDAELRTVRAQLRRSEVAETSRQAALESELKKVKERLAHEEAEAIKVQARLAQLTEELCSKEASNRDLALQLEMSKLLERQAVEKAQESLDVLEEVHNAAPWSQEIRRFPTPLDQIDSMTKQLYQGPDVAGGLPAAQAKVVSVLISVELELGMGKTGTLCICPWHTRSEFHGVVHEFLKEHHVRPLFLDCLVHYLEELESQAVVFPAKAKACLSELYSRFG
jgi:hypothetical protein